MERRFTLPPDYQGPTVADLFTLRPILESQDEPGDAPKHYRLYDQLHRLVTRSLYINGSQQARPDDAMDVVRGLTSSAAWKDLRQSGRLLEPAEVQAMQILDKTFGIITSGYQTDAMQAYNTAVMMKHNQIKLANDAGPSRQQVGTDPIASKLDDALLCNSIGLAFQMHFDHLCDGKHCVLLEPMTRGVNFDSYNMFGDTIRAAQRGEWPKPPRKRVSVLKTVMAALQLDKVFRLRRPTRKDVTKRYDLPPAANDPE